MPISRIGTDGIENGAVAPADLSTGGPYWDGSGNVGVGTSSPTDRLDVRFATGTGNLKAAVTAGNNIKLFNTTGDLALTTADAASDLIADSQRNVILKTANVERLRIEADGDQTFFRALKFYGEKRIQYTASAFNNPTLSLVSFAVVPVNGQYPQIIVKVTVFQTGWSSNVGNIHNGYATTSYSDASNWNAAVANTMVVEANLGTANVGTLSWSTSGTTRTLSYTTNRATNFDSYVIKVEIATSVNGSNFNVEFLN